MTTLFDTLPDKEHAIALAWSGTSEGWRNKAIMAVEQLCATNEYFTTDDLPTEIANGVKEPRALGALMTLARKMGLCETTNTTRASTQRKNHNRPKRVWRSLKF